MRVRTTSCKNRKHRMESARPVMNSEGLFAAKNFRLRSYLPFLVGKRTQREILDVILPTPRSLTTVSILLHKPPFTFEILIGFEICTSSWLLVIFLVRSFPGSFFPFCP